MQRMLKRNQLYYFVRVPTPKQKSMSWFCDADTDVIRRTINTSQTVTGDVLWLETIGWYNTLKLCKMIISQINS